MFFLANATSGAFEVDNYTLGIRVTGSNVNGYRKCKFDASKSNAIYGNSTTVQSPALQLMPQIRF